MHIDKKRELQVELEGFYHQFTNNTIILRVEFNAIVDLTEKSGGVRKDLQSLIDFRQWVNKINLLEIKVVNGNFTSNKKRLGFSQITKKTRSVLLQRRLEKISILLKL